MGGDWNFIRLAFAVSAFSSIVMTLLVVTRPAQDYGALLYQIRRNCDLLDL
jgi:hypothetical protein